MKAKLCILLFIITLHSNAQIADFKHVSFKKADSIAMVYKNESLDNLPKLSYKLTSDLSTDVERFRAIYKWVCCNIANDYQFFHKNKRKRKKYIDDSLRLKNWNNHFRKVIFKALLKDKRTVCTGYAYLIKKLSELANLECKIIQGIGKTSSSKKEELNTPNHSWNAIKLNNKWYLCDATWASGTQNPITLNFNFKYNDGFFLTNPKLFATNHYPVNNKWLLINKNPPTFKEFLEGPILYGKAYQNLTHHKAPFKLHQSIQKNKNVAFQYQLKKNIKEHDVTLLIDNGFKNNRTKPTAVSIENKSLTFYHSFTRKGFYDVHLYIGDDLISTYTFQVKS